MVRKIKESLALISILLILVIGIGMVQASEDTVLSLDDSSDLSLNESSGGDAKHFEDIQNQIDKAKENDTITLEKGTYTPKNTDDDYVSIQVNKSLRIVGNDTIMDAKQMWGILFVNSSDRVVLENIAFKNSLFCAVDVFNSNIELNNCTFDSIRGSAGVGMHITANERDVAVDINDCTFKNNIADLGGGSVGGAMFLEAVDYQIMANISNTLFANNTAAMGGAIYLSSPKKTSALKINRCTFDSNAFIDQTYIEDIYPQSSGADIAIDESSKCEVEITDSSFFDKMAISEFGNPAAYDAVVLRDSKASFINDSFNNTGLSFEKTSADFDGCDFNNVLMQAYYDLNRDYDADMSQVSLNFNDCDVNDSYINIGCGNVTDSRFIKSTISKDVACDLKIDNCEFKEYSSVDANNQLTVLNSRFSKSQIAGYDYVVFNVANSTFRDSIDLTGAAIVVSQGDSKNKSVINISDCQFINNTARYWGGAISIQVNSQFGIRNSIFINNSARNGGAVFANKGSGKISNSIFEENHAEDMNNATIEYFKKHYQSTGVPLEYLFKYYEDIYVKDYPEWDSSEYGFPTFVYGADVITEYSPIVKVFYGSAVYGKNIDVENNFWGYNLDDADELLYGRIINKDVSVPEKWVNYSNGTFTDNNGSVVEMPKYTPTGADRNHAVMTITQIGNEFTKTNITVNLVDAKTGEPIKNQKVLIVLTNNQFYLIFTDENGTATYEALESPDHYHVFAVSEIPGYNVACNMSEASIGKLQAVGTATKLTTTYNSGKKITITILDKVTLKPAGTPLTVVVKVYTGKKCTTKFWATTNSKGIATVTPGTKVNVGTHNVVVVPYESDFALNKVTTTLKITKAKTTVKAPKVTNKYKKSKYFKVTVKNKATGKVVKNTKVKVKVYTGKKTKTYTIKTNSKGLAKLNTKSLKIGKHKVVISSGNTNYVMSAKSTIVIKR